MEHEQTARIPTEIEIAMTSLWTSLADPSEVVCCAKIRNRGSWARRTGRLWIGCGGHGSFLVEGRLFCHHHHGQPTHTAFRFRVPNWRSRDFPRSVRLGLLRESNGACVACGSDADTIDHVWPRSRGGIGSAANGAAMCRSCNSRKGVS